MRPVVPASNLQRKPAAATYQESHHTLPHWAKLWGYSEDTLRPYFASHPSVIKIERPEDARKHKRRYTSLRIPDSVALQVYEQLRKAA
jgi:hypothetical protein